MLAILPLPSSSVGKMENEKRLLTLPELQEGIGEKELFQLIMDFSDSGKEKIGVVVPTCSRNEANVYFAAADRFSGTFPEYLLTVYTDDKETLQYLLDIDSLTMRLRSKTVANPDVAVKKGNTTGKKAKGIWGILNRLFGINTDVEQEYDPRNDLTVADTGIEDEEEPFFCPVCGEQISNRARYCSKCGSEVKSLATAEKPSTVSHDSILQAISFRMKHKDKSFYEQLIFYIDSKEMTDVQVYKAAHVDKRIFSTMRSKGDKYKPSKTTALAFAFALQLSLDQTKDLLSRANLALSPNDTFDIIVEQCIARRIYNLFDVNDYLYRFEQPTFPMAS